MEFNKTLYLRIRHGQCCMRCDSARITTQQTPARVSPSDLESITSTPHRQLLCPRQCVFCSILHANLPWIVLKVTFLPPAPKAKNDRIIDLFWFLTPNRIQADMGRIQRYGTRIWRSEMPIDRLGPGVACMVRIAHVRGVHATHTPAQHTPKCTTKVTCPLSTHNSRTIGRRPAKPYTTG